MQQRWGFSRHACGAGSLAIGLILPFAVVPVGAASLQTFSFSNGDDIEFHLSGDGNWLVYSQMSEEDPGWSSTLVGSGGTTPVDGEVKGISFDGSVLVGAGNDGYGFVLDNGSLTSIGDFTTNAAQPWQKGSSASAVSRNGQVVIGVAQTDTGQDIFRWTGGALTDLGELPSGRWGSADVLSADGSVIAGTSHVGNNDVGYVWSTTNSTMTALGTLPGGGPGSYVNAMSADGTTIVGQADTSPAQQFIHAYRWTEATGMVDLGTFAGGNDSVATAVSADGAVVAGYAESSPGFSQAFRWTESDGLVSLGNLGPGLQSGARAMSDDGTVIVGYSDVAGGGGTGFHWDATDGMQSIADYLTAGGLDVSGWDFTNADQISADGRSMAGNGNDGTHFNGIWYARCDWDTQCAVISDGNAADSFASLGALGGGPNTALAGDFAQLGHALDTSGSGASASLYGSLDSDPAASAGVVLSFKPSDAVAAAVGLGTSRIDTPLAYGGDAAFDATSLSASLGLQPADGFTARLGVSGLELSGTVARGYLNGNSAAQSSGDTSGWAAGLDALAGWRFANALPETSLLAYAELGLSRTSYDGWTETGGPFPATIAGFTVDSATLRAGLEARHSLGSITAAGRIAFVHQQNSGTPIDGTIVGAFGSEVDPAVAATDWVELGGGLDLPTGTAGQTSLDVTVRLPTGGGASVAAQAGLHLPL